MKLRIILGLTLACSLIAVQSCEKKIGFLAVDENAGYGSKTLLVYVDPPASSNQARYNTPYFTNSVEGVQGTLPLTYSLHGVTTEDGDAEQMISQMEIQPGIGKVVIPADHTIPMGSYHISLMVSNSYGTHVLEDIVEIIVQ